MEFRDLTYFLQAANSGHLGRAARSLGLSQPALTKSVARLERELRARLFERTPKGVKLTDFGEHVLRHAVRLRDAVDDIKRELEDLSSGATGHLRIGTGVAMSHYLLPRACAKLLAQWPRVTLDITAGTGRSLIPLLRDGHLDLVLSGIEPGQQGDLQQEAIMKDQVVVIARRTHPIHRRHSITLKEILRQRWVMSKSSSLISEWLARRCAELGVPPPVPAVQTDSMSTLLSLVAGSDLLTFHSWSSIRHSPLRSNVRRVVVSRLVWHRQVGVSYRRNGYLPAAARQLIDILKDISASDEAGD